MYDILYKYVNIQSELCIISPVHPFSDTHSAPSVLQTHPFAGILGESGNAAYLLNSTALDGIAMYLAIEGVIGVGKTTLARLLQPLFNTALLLEVFEENPFLSDFYADRARYAFQTQTFFLLSRYHQQRRAVPEILKRGESLVADYTFEKDALFARINLGGDELDMYYKVHEALAEKIPLPDLIVYLRADTDILMQRIALRDRPYERNMEREYIHQLSLAYDEFFVSHHKGAPVITFETDQLDFVHDLSQLKYVENRVRQALRMTPFQTELPLEMVENS
jgi:deoxyguanosine kinase